MLEEPKKTCPRCTKHLHLFKFAKNKNRKDGLQAYCRSCLKNIKKKSKIKNPPPLKTCSMCNQTFPRSEFWKNKSQRDGLQGYCKPCNKIKTAAYRNRPEVKARLDLSNWLWRQDNIERVRAASKVRCARYRERHRELLNARMRARRRTQKYIWLRQLMQKPTAVVAN